MGKKEAGDQGVGAKLGRKVYEAELARLQAELVAMQEWVKSTGAKICIVFEGRARDGLLHTGAGGEVPRDGSAG